MDRGEGGQSGEPGSSPDPASPRAVCHRRASPSGRRPSRSTPRGQGAGRQGLTGRPRCGDATMRHPGRSTAPPLSAVALLVVGAERAGGSSVAPRVAGFSGAARPRGEKQGFQSHSLRILGAASRPGAPAPFASGGIAPHPDGPPGRGDGDLVRFRGLRRVPAAASARPDVLEPAPLFAERVPRTASRSHGVSGWPCVLPVLVGIHRSCFVIAPVVMWAGRRAVQGPGVGRRPSPGRHVHGRAVRGARGGGSLDLRTAPRTGRPASSRSRPRWRGSRGLRGHMARNRAGQSQSLRILGESVRPGGPHPFASGGIAPNRTVHRNAGTAVSFVEWSAPRPGGCVLSH